jgi:hypothetical protein
MIWKGSAPAHHGSHHLLEGVPLYAARFDEVLPFHEPGRAPVRLGTEAFHILPDGRPAYPQRYTRTFGFYEERAAVVHPSGWFHILADGSAAYSERYAWVGNYQGGRCSVRSQAGEYFHLDPDGRPAYLERYCYAGDFRERAAVVQRADGLHVHIDPNGRPLSSGAWIDLSPFHKGLAVARDLAGWTHIDRSGHPQYGARYTAAEAFYNGQARVEASDGALMVIGERGELVRVLRQPHTGA